MLAVLVKFCKILVQDKKEKGAKTKKKSKLLNERMTWARKAKRNLPE